LFRHGVDRSFSFRSCGGGTMLGRMVAKIVRSVECVDALVAFYEEEPFEEAPALVMEEIFVPLSFGELGNDDDDAAIGLLSGELKDVLDNRNDYEAIGRGKADEFWRRVAGGFERFDHKAIPLFVEDFRVFVGLDVNGDDVGGETRGEF